MAFSRSFQTMMTLSCLLVFGCDRPTPEKTDARILIQFPSAGHEAIVQGSASFKTNSTFSDGSKWLGAPPSTTADFNCFMLVLAGSDGHPSLTGNSCKRLDGSVMFQGGIIAGGFRPNSAVRILVPVGKDRSLYLVGFRTSDLSQCVTDQSRGGVFSPQAFSKPYLLTTYRGDFEPGSQTVTMTIPSALQDSQIFEDCEPRRLGPSANGLNPEPVPPTAPGRPVVTLDSPNELHLSWTGSTGTGPITYSIERSQFPNGPFSGIANGLTTTNFTDTSVSGGTDYYYRIQANGPSGSTFSSIAPGTPIGSFSLTATTPGDLSATLTWTSAAGASSYRIRYGTTSGLYTFNGGINVTSPAVVSSLVADQVHFFLVEAQNSFGSISVPIEGSASPFTTPVSLFSSSNGTTVCARFTNNRVKCWGSSTAGILGPAFATMRGEAPENIGANAAYTYLGTGTDRQIATLFSSPNSNHYCALTTTSKVLCWGNNIYGQLGYGDTLDRGGSSSEMGDNLEFVDLGNGAHAVQLALGSMHTCAILSDGSVKCWGFNSSGQLGINNNQPRGDQPNEMGNSLQSVILPPGRTAVAIAAAGHANCAILDNQTVFCWGQNATGQLGIGNATAKGNSPSSMESIPATDLGTGFIPQKIVGGFGSFCALSNEGQVKCWGDNAQGQLGLSDTAGRGDVPGEMGDNLPVLATGGTVLDLAAGSAHFCALITGGTVKCWGDNALGQLGVGSTDDFGGAVGQTVSSQTPVDLGTNRHAISIYAGGLSSCALLDNGQAKCWGQNSSGQLGLGDKINRGNTVGTLGDNLDVVSSGTSPWASFALAGNSMCGKRVDGSISCFGANNSGQLGAGLPSEAGIKVGSMGSNLPYLEIGTNAQILQMDLSAAHACALIYPDRVKCWGDNSQGQLGQGDTLPRGKSLATWGDNIPFVDFGTGLGAQKVVTGGAHTCVLLLDGRLKCWGHNNFGQLGIGATGNRGALPNQMGDNLPFVDLGTGRTAVDVAVGVSHTCALLDNGGVKCWGSGGSGALGYENTTNVGISGMGNSLPEVNLGSGQVAIRIAASGTQTCALLQSGLMKCWGNGANGKLGNNSTVTVGYSVGTMGNNNGGINFGSGANPIKMSLGIAHSCAIFDNGDLKCWGAATAGQLGQGTTQTWGSNNTRVCPHLTV